VITLLIFQKKFFHKAGEKQQETLHVSSET
jgi:hypothetical protein